MNTLASQLGSAWAVLAAIVGSFGAILMALAGLWHSRRNLRLQLAQQSQEAKLMREMDLRREVFLDAAAALARATGSLPAMADVHSESDELTRQYATDLATVAKLHVVASPDTIAALMVMTRELGESQVELKIARFPLLELHRRLQSSALDATEQARLARELTLARAQVAELAMQCADRVARHAPAAIAAIRRELDLPLDLETYRAAFARDWAQGQSHLQRQIDIMRSDPRAR